MNNSKKGARALAWPSLPSVVLLLVILLTDCSQAFYLIGGTEESQYGNVLYYRDNSKDGSYQEVTRFDNWVPWSGRLTFSALSSSDPVPPPFNTSFFAWLIASDAPNCMLVQYDFMSNTTTTLTTIVGYYTFDLSYDPSDGGRLWTVLGIANQTEFRAGYYSLSQGKWIDFAVILSGKPAILMSQDFLSAALDWRGGNYYIIYQNNTNFAEWLATLSTNTGEVTFRRFPHSGVGLKAWKRRVASPVLQWRNLEHHIPLAFVEFTYSTQKQALFAICDHISFETGNAYVLCSIDLTSMKLVPLPVLTPLSDYRLNSLFVREERGFADLPSSDSSLSTTVLRLVTESSISRRASSSAWIWLLETL